MKNRERADRIRLTLTRAHGAALGRHLVREPADRAALRRMVATGDLERHGQVIALPGTDPHVLTCRSVSGLIACAHALEAAGAPLRDPPGRILHVLAPRSPRLVPARTVVHVLPGLQIDPLRSPYADLETTLLTYIRCAEAVDAVIALDYALRIGATTHGDLLARLPGNRNGRARATVRRADGRARSILESIARVDLEDAGAAVRIAVPSPAGELDLVLGSIDIETDGYEFHSKIDDWTLDRLRDQHLTASGYTVVRLTSRQVLSRRTVEIVKPVAQRLGVWPEPPGHTLRRAA